MTAPTASGLLCALAIAASCASPVTGQHGDAAETAKAQARVVICDLPGRSLPIAQAEDGRFPANWSRTDAAEEAGLPAFDLRVTSFAILGLLADGSTIRSGPFKDPLKHAVIWLRGQQDEHGRFGLSTEPDWVLDHAIGTYALCEAGRLSRYRILRERVGAAIAILVDHLRRMERDVDPELLLWARMVARSASAYEADSGDESLRPDQPRWESGAGDLDAQVVRLVAAAVPAAARRRAARLLLEDLAGDASDAALRERLAAPFVAADRLDVIDDPLAMFYATVALYRIGGAAWHQMEARLKEQVVRTQRSEDPDRATWDPRGEFGARHGRNGTTAVNLLALTIYYRYCALDCAHR